MSGDGAAPVLLFQMMRTDQFRTRASLRLSLRPGGRLSAARPEIDCDDNPTFCAERYD